MSNVKIGDRVRLTDPINYGDVGTVIKVYATGDVEVGGCRHISWCITNQYEVIKEK